jgi:hypothetical protein
MAKLKDGNRIYGNANIDSTLTTLDLVVTGNMTIQGTTTTVDSTITTIEDPVITLGTNATNDGLDRGLILQYNDGAAKTGFLGWDQSAGEFALASTTTWDSANNAVTIGTYGNIHGLHFIGQGDTLGNITGANVTGTVPNANNSAFAGNVTGNAQANITSVGTLTGLTVGNATANTTFGNGTITAGGVVAITDTTEATSTSTGALKVTGGAAILANLHVGGNIYGNFAGNIAAKGANTQVQFNDDGAQNATAGFTFTKSSNAVTVIGTITGGNLSTAGNLSVTSNANVGNIGSNNVVATGNITTGNVTISDSTVSALGNVSGGNLTTGGLVNATGNVTGGNLTTAGDVTTVTVTASGNISTTANLSVTGNATITLVANAAGGFTTGGNIDGTGASSTLNIKNIIATGTANVTSSVTAGSFETLGNANVTGNVTGGNLITTGKADIGNLSISGNVTGNLIPSAHETYNLGADGLAWKDLYLSGSSIKLGSQLVTSNAAGINLSNTIFATDITATNTMSTTTLLASGAITGANVTANNLSNTQVAFADGSKIVGSSSFIFTSTTGTLSANLFTGTLTTAAQPNITSVGTLLDLTVANTISGSVNGSANTVTNAAQANITSVGTLTGLVVSGNIQSNANVITDNILAVGTNITITAGAGNSNITLAPTGTGTVDVSSKRITGLATPTQSSDAATKGYVDGAAQGLDIKNSVRVATTTNITLSGTQTVDSVVLVAGNRVLVKDQTNASQNGIYVVSASSWTRALDADDNGELTAGSFTFVEEGTLYHDTGWVISTNGEIVIGTDPMNWTQFSGAGQLTASDGVQLIGSNFSANVDNSTIAVVSGALKVKDGLTLTTPNIGVATGTSLNLGSGTIDSGNITVAANADITLSGADSQITGANLVSANYFTGTLTTASQPNITSVGTLGNLSITTTLNVASNAFIANANGIYTNGYYYANGEAIDFQTAAGTDYQIQFHAVGANDLAASANLTFSASNELGVTGTANISGLVTAGNIVDNALTSTHLVFAGSSKELSGSANLTFADNRLTVTGNANVSSILTAGNVKSSGLTSGRVTFAGTEGLLSDNGNLSFNDTTNELQAGNANVAGYFTAGNVTARNLSTAGRIVITGSAGLLSDSGNLSFDTSSKTLVVDNANASGNITAAQFIGNGVQITNIAGANVTGTVENANVAVTVSGNAQANITSVGTLTGLTVSGLTSLGAVGNVTVTGGTTGQFLKTDGAGVLSFASIDTSRLANGTSEVSIPSVNGDIQITRGGTLVLTVTGTGANVVGILDVTGNINGNNISAANTITASANTDSTTSITGTIKVTGGMAATGNIYTGKSVGFANNNGGTASKAYIQFNDTANSLDFIFN